MATIHKALQKSLDRIVAIKQIHSHLSEQREFVLRFEREAKAAAHLRHVNILDVIDFGRDDDGSYYTVVEFVDGPSLHKILKSGQELPLDFVLSMMLQVLAGLEFAHNNGIVHRDVKPANIMLNSSGIAKLGDFGIAQAAQLPSITKVGQTLGTPSYMSPEQAAGNKVDQRSDLFSIGVVLFEMLTGQLPFSGDSDTVIRKIRNDPHPSLKSLRPNLPEALGGIVDKALAKDVTARFFDAGEFAYALENVAFAEQVRCSPRVCQAYLTVLAKNQNADGTGEGTSASEIRRQHPSTGVDRRPTVALLPLQGCFGCHVNLLDLHEDFLDLPRLMDFRFSYLMDIKQIPEVDIGLVEGAVANRENETRLRELRERCKTLVALGTCAAFGGVPGLRNLHSTAEVMATAYRESPSTTGDAYPDPKRVPVLTERVYAVSEIVPVDHTIPGCPSPRPLVLEALTSLVNGSKLRIPTRNLCYECNRKHREILTSQRAYIADEVKSLMELERIDPTLCFLEQGVLCIGNATREGCGARCPSHNMPCQGCMGPPPRVTETVAKWIDCIGSLLPGGPLRFRHDLIGFGYRYTMPISLLPTRMPKKV
jgi:F420-non-reducing hydrogenase small subunit